MNPTPFAMIIPPIAKLKGKISHDSHLLLLSATPINNSYLDLVHQLSLKGTHIIINGMPLNPIAICKRANEITKKANEEPQQDAPDSYNEIILPPDYYKLCNIIFSRSANEIEQYLKSLGKSLPKKAIEIKKLSSIPPHIDFSIDSLLEILGVNYSQNSLSFCIYDPYNERYLPREIIDELKSSMRADNTGSLYGFLVEVANQTPQLQKSLHEILNQTHTRALRELRAVGASPSDIKAVFDSYKQGIEEGYASQDNRAKMQKKTRARF